MKPLSTLILCAAIGLCSCHSGKGPTYTPLTETSIYTIDSVKMATTGGDEKAANKLLEQAVQLYKKGPDTARSIELFKQSILLHPTAKAYYELAGALISTHQYREGIQALHVTEKLGFTPLSNVMYRYTLAYSNLSGGDPLDATWQDSSRYYMQLAIQMGYQRPQQFLRKDLFPALHSMSGFDAAYNSAMLAGSGKSEDKSLWEIFRSHFSNIQLPLVIDQAWIRNNHQEDDIAYEFEKFIPIMRDDNFEREPNNEYYYVGLIAANTGYTALLYSVVPTEQDDSSQIASFYLTTFDNHGTQIDIMEVAGSHELTSPFKVFSMQPSLQFTVQEFAAKADSTTQTEQTAQAGDNTADSARIMPREPLPLQAFQIAADGKFVKIEKLALR